MTDSSSKAVDGAVITGAGLLAIGIGGLVWLDAVNGTLRSSVIPTTIWWFLIAAVGYVLLFALQGRTETIFSWRWLLGLGVLLRLALLFTEPTLSDDVYRYIWEGHLVTQGVSPWEFPIESPQGDPFDIAARGLANNTSFASPYLPVAQGIFATSTLIGPLQPITMQIVMVGFDLVAVFVMLRLLRALGLPEKRSLIYWLNPLVIVEIAHGAHLDAIIVAFTMLALWLTFDVANRHPRAVELGIVALAAATLTRPLAALFVAVFFWRWTWPQRILYGVLTLVPVGGVAAISGLGLTEGDTTGAFGSALTYGRTFRFNSGIFHWFGVWISRQPEVFDRGYEASFDLAREILVPIVAIAMLALFIRARHVHEPLQAIRFLTAPLIVYVLFTTVLHPWYILVLLMLLPFMAPAVGETALRWVLLGPWVALSVLLIFSYLTFENPLAHAELEWVRRVEWLPTFGLLLVAGVAAAILRLGQPLASAPVVPVTVAEKRIETIEIDVSER